MLPAGVIDRVDREEEKVFVNRTKDEIKNAPEFDETRYRDEQYRDELGGYYGRSREDGSNQNVSTPQLPRAAAASRLPPGRRRGGGSDCVSPGRREYELSGSA